VEAFIGVSAANILHVVDIKKMARDPIVFAMANPTSEIMPDVAAPYVAVMGTGRSDFPNQVNNLLCVPGICRGALDARASMISEKMKLAAAHAIAAVVGNERSAEYVIPSVFDSRVVDDVALAVRETAIEEGLRADPSSFKMMMPCLPPEKRVGDACPTACAIRVLK
jgi:malate dehydrogenase (oxaloacetate-decarboxylating)